MKQLEADLEADVGSKGSDGSDDDAPVEDAADGTATDSDDSFEIEVDDFGQDGGDELAAQAAEDDDVDAPSVEGTDDISSREVSHYALRRCLLTFRPESKPPDETEAHLALQSGYTQVSHAGAHTVVRQPV